MFDEDALPVQERGWRNRGMSAKGIDLILRAACFAADKHRSQRRKDAAASPYINHPLDLAHILAADGGISDANVIAAALLHDTVEDTETTLEELTGAFGPKIAAIVAEVTDDKTLPSRERKRLQVVKASSKSPEAKLVKLADKIANLRDLAISPPESWDDKRRRAYARWAKRVVAGLRGSNGRLETAFDQAHAQALAALRPRRAPPRRSARPRRTAPHRL
ncbi:MAG: HD domain-containing protein [Sphingosinicella sp.]